MAEHKQSLVSLGRRWIPKYGAALGAAAAADAETSAAPAISVRGFVDMGIYGADVIKIERAGAGDLSRWSIGEDPDGGNNPVFGRAAR